VSDSTPTLTVLKTDRLPFKVDMTLYVEYPRPLVEKVLSFFKTKALPLQDGPGFKANRTKVLKTIVSDIAKIDSPYTDDVVHTLNDLLNPSPSRPVMDTSSDYDLLMEALNAPDEESKDEENEGEENEEDNA
jgi:hypothetical protein